MKARILAVVLVGLALLVTGCASMGGGSPVGGTTGGGVATPPVSGNTLDKWLPGAMDDVEESLKTTMRGRSFIIVGAKEDGDQMSPEIDGLTREIRDQLTRKLRGDPTIKLVTRRPVEVLERPQELQYLDCGEYADTSLYLCIRVKAKSGNRADVEFFALDLKSSQAPVIQGFSVYTKEPVSLARDQAQMLAARKSDQQLKGLEYLPFTPEEMNKTGAYLARNLTCRYRDAYPQGDFTFYVDTSALPARDENIGVFLARQLENYFQGLHTVNDPSRADLIITLTEVETGTPGQYQIFARTMGKEGASNLSGIGTDAYYQRPDGVDLSGNWRILSGSNGGSAVGTAEIHKTNGSWAGAFYTPQHVLMGQGPVEIKLEGLTVSWAIWDSDRHCLIEASGAVDNRVGKTMSVRLKGSYCTLDQDSWHLSRL
ncbi:MAG: hypothetical protein ABIM40_01810 [Pseudomonadota bacterium]